MLTSPDQLLGTSRARWFDYYQLPLQAQALRAPKSEVFMDRWKTDLAEVIARSPRRWTIWPPTLLFHMPHWWPVKVDAWAHLNMIFIGSGIIDAPPDVRRYVVAHEYGHIRSGHTLLHAFYWVSVAGMCAGIVQHNTELYLLAWGLLVVVAIGLIAPPFVRQREYTADDVAAGIWGRETALRGSLWMAERSHTLESEFRQARLRRLGWQPDDS